MCTVCTGFYSAEKVICKLKNKMKFTHASLSANEMNRKLLYCISLDTLKRNVSVFSLRFLLISELSITYVSLVLFIIVFTGKRFLMSIADSIHSKITTKLFVCANVKR